MLSVCLLFPSNFVLFESLRPSQPYPLSMSHSWSTICRRYLCLPIGCMKACKLHEGRYYSELASTVFVFLAWR